MNAENRYIQLNDSLSELGLSFDDYIEINRHATSILNSLIKSSQDLYDAKVYIEDNFESLFAGRIPEEKWQDIDEGLHTPDQEDPYYHCKVIISSVIQEVRRHSETFYSSLNGFIKKF